MALEEQYEYDRAEQSNESAFDVLKKAQEENEKLQSEAKGKDAKIVELNAAISQLTNNLSVKKPKLTNTRKEIQPLIYVF